MPEIRHHLIGQAIGWEATHLLMLQPELVFPPDSIHQLLARARAIVGVNYLKDIVKQEYAAYRESGSLKPDPVSPETAEVNGIAPGPTLKNKRQSAQHFKKQYMATPLKRQVDVEQICNAVDFFIKNRSITGQVISVDSGQSLNWQTPDIMRGKE